MLRPSILAPAVLGIVAVASTAVAAPDQWIVHAKAIGMIADDDSGTIAGTGTGVAVADSFGLGLGAVWIPAPSWGIELDAEWTPLDLTTAGGDFPGLDVGSVDSVAARLSLQFRFATRGRIDPHIGVGVTYTTFPGYSTTVDMQDAGIADVTFSSSLRLCTQAGADIDLGHGWLVSVEALYAPATTRVGFRQPSGASLDQITLQVNPILISVGLGRSF